MCQLPLTFFCSILDDVEKENAAAKLLILLDKPALSLLDLFHDLVESREMGEPLTNTKQVTIATRSGHTVSVLVSKDDLKIRFQSNDASALQLIVVETYERLQ